MANELALLKKAFYRTKERFFIFVLFYALYFISGLLFVLSALFGLAYPQSAYLALALVFLLGGFVFHLLANLSTVIMLIDEHKLTFRQVLKKTMSYFRGYTWFSLLSGLFLFGLVPLGVVSVFIILLLWSLWSMFAVFVFIEKRKKGLENLWISRIMVKERFWYVAGNSLLVAVPAVMLTIGIAFFFKNERTQFIASFLYGLFFYPFMISFFYELYKTLPKLEHVKTPKVWLILSVIGWIIIGGFVFISISYPDFIPSSDTPCVNTETIRCLPS